MGHMESLFNNLTATDASLCKGRDKVNVKASDWLALSLQEASAINQAKSNDELEIDCSILPRTEKLEIHCRWT